MSVGSSRTDALSPRIERAVAGILANGKVCHVAPAGSERAADAHLARALGARMMFMIPDPATRRPIAATAPGTTLKARGVRSRWRRFSLGTITSIGSSPVARQTKARATPAPRHVGLRGRDAEYDLVRAVARAVSAAV